MRSTKSLVIDSTKEEDMLQIYPCSSILSSTNLNWDGIHLKYYRLPPHEIPENFSQQHLILIHTQIPPRMKLEQRFDGRLEKTQMQNGDVVIVPANMSHQASWDREHSYIGLSLDTEKLANSTPLTDIVELVPCFQKTDPLILAIGMALKAEIESKAVGENLYIDSLTNTLSLHLLRHYSTKKISIKEYTDGLPKYKLRQIVEYINENIEHNFTLAELATLINMSPSYFSYLFKLSTGYSPHQYVIRLRVERAKQLLLQEQLAIADIAYSLGFAHQSHLNRHFKRLVGVTPKKFQQQK